MKKIFSLVLLLFLVLTPLQNASGMTISVAPLAKVSGSTAPSVCVRTGSGQVCLPVCIPSGNTSIIRSGSSGNIVIKVNGQVITAPRATPSPAGNAGSSTTPAAGSSVSVSASTMQQEMLGYINAERAKVKAPALSLDKALCDGAYLKSKDMAVNGYFSHTSPTYGSPFEMMKSLGITYRAAGENIAKNSSVKGAHDAFMNSSGHRANILNTSFKKVGLGFYSYNNYLYVTQWFTN